MKNFFYVFVLITLFPSYLVNAQEECPLEKAERMQWFKDAKLGIFIHWGIYSVNGISESWSFFNERISHEDYMKQLDGFTAKNYDPAYWVELIKGSGARYAVITTKHHDGVALWETKEDHYSTIEHTPAKADLIKPFVKELRKADLKVGLYYSLLDWSHPDYPNLTRNTKRYENDSLRWERFVKFNNSQINEIGIKFKPDLYWFDGDWEQSAEKWHAAEIRKSILDLNKKAIINSRLQGYGDYATPEIGVPVYRPKDKYWELCLTMNDSWGFQFNDTNYKTPNQLIRIFTDCISMGGNLLLDIGPKEDGTIPPEQENILKEFGRWTQKHAEAIYETEGGIPKECFAGPSTISADSTKLYLFVEHKPNGPILIKGLNNYVNSAWIVGNGTSLNKQIHCKPYWSKHAGLLYIDVPEQTLDPQITVIGLLLDSKLNISTEK